MQPLSAQLDDTLGTRRVLALLGQLFALLLVAAGCTVVQRPGVATHT